MLDKLKLLHAYIGGLIPEVEAGRLVVLEASAGRVLDRESLTVLVERVNVVPAGCDHDWRRMASGEYECRTPGCGVITDEPEGEQWN